MTQITPTLHLLCGKIASGKSTLAKELGEAEATVIISEDHWLAALYPEEIVSLSDMVCYSARLRNIMGIHVASLLNAGVSVVLDFPANTVANRKWMGDIIRQTDAAHKLHVLDVPDEVCKARLHARNRDGEHPFKATEEQYLQISQYFVPPSAEEGFEIVLHSLK